MLRRRITITSRLAAGRCLSSLGSKSCCSRGSCLLDRTSVMILVTRQGCAASESLLTVGIRALVWSLAGMDAAMTGQ